MVRSAGLRVAAADAGVGIAGKQGYRAFDGLGQRGHAVGNARLARPESNRALPPRERFGGYATDEVAHAPEPFDARHHW
jgi:hypothetical protein